MTKISVATLLNKSEVKLTFIRSSGPGGQNVNKVATAVLLRFNIMHSTSLPDDIRVRLLTLVGKRITSQGDILIKGILYRTQEKNKQDALCRLQKLLDRATVVVKKRKKTKPSFASKQQRLNTKKIQSNKKILRGNKYSDVD